MLVSRIPHDLTGLIEQELECMPVSKIEGLHDDVIRATDALEAGYKLICNDLATIESIMLDQPNSANLDLSNESVKFRRAWNNIGWLIGAEEPKWGFMPIAIDRQSGKLFREHIRMGIWPSLEEMKSPERREFIEKKLMSPTRKCHERESKFLKELEETIGKLFKEREQAEEEHQLAANKDTPEWKKSSRELYFKGTCIKRVKNKTATRVVAILDLFQEKKWPQSVVLDERQFDSSNRSENVRSLNTNGTKKRIEGILFECCGDGKSVSWRVL